MSERDTQSRAEGSEATMLHASCVAFGGRAVLITGASGSGKSALALQLMALGAQLVADDRTTVWTEEGEIKADAPDRLRGMIEAREVGILRASPAGPSRIVLIVDMDTPETERLPEEHSLDLLGFLIPVLRKSELPHFPAAIMTYLRGQREA